MQEIWLAVDMHMSGQKTISILIVKPYAPKFDMHRNHLGILWNAHSDLVHGRCVFCMSIKLSCDASAAIYATHLNSVREKEVVLKTRLDKLSEISQMKKGDELGLLLSPLQNLMLSLWAKLVIYGYKV